MLAKQALKLLNKNLKLVLQDGHKFRSKATHVGRSMLAGQACKLPELLPVHAFGISAW